MKNEFNISIYKKEQTKCYSYGIPKQGK